MNRVILRFVSLLILIFGVEADFGQIIYPNDDVDVEANANDSSTGRRRSHLEFSLSVSR